MIPMSPEAFEHAVADGLDAVPEELAAALRNVAIVIDDDSPPGEPELFGLDVGVPLTERDEWWAAGSLPDRVTIFREPILRHCATADEVRRQVTVTVVHEIAHHFGIDDDRLHELGWS
jgi:predicted Zn-dependent protease with MMP-like domain